MLVALAVAALAACSRTSVPTQPAPAGAVPAAAAASQARPVIDWAALQKAVGTYDAQTDFLRQPGLNQRLRALLGARYDVLQRNLEVAGPLELDKGIYYVIGNRAHMGGAEAAAIALQPVSNTLRVWLLHKGRAQVLEEERNSFAWPADVQTTIQNHNAAPR